MIDDIGVIGAFFGGILSLLSPCSALLLPAFFAYAFKTKQELFAKTGVFFLGLLTVLVPIGLFAGTVGAFFTQHRGVLNLVAGILIIVMGVLSLLGVGFQIPFLSKLNTGARSSTFVLGLVYGFSGSCAGPLLGAVFATAAFGANPLKGALTFGFYGLGMTIPLLVLAALWKQFKIGSLSFLRGRWPMIVSGILFIGIGLLFVFNGGAGDLPTLLGLDEQVALQHGVLKFSSIFETPVTLFVIIGIAIVGIVIYLLRTGGFTNNPQSKSESDTAHRQEK